MASLALPEPHGYYGENQGKPPALSFSHQHSPDEFLLQAAAVGTSIVLDRGTDNPQAEVSHGLPLPLAKGGTEAT